MKARNWMPSGIELPSSSFRPSAVLSRIMQVSLDPEYGPERKVNAVPRRRASTEKARRQLGFSASVPLEDGLRRLVEWWRAQRAGAAA